MSAVGLSLLLFAAQAAGPPAPEPAKPAATQPAEPCQNRQQKQGEIIICAERPNGYRLNPDLIEAKRELKIQKLKRPENFAHSDCATVGPMGCRGGPTINLIAAALTAAEMAQRLAKGEEIGSMFQTTPEPTEYQLYLEAKRQREAREAEAAAAKTKAKAEAIEAAAAPQTPAPPAD